MKMAPGGLVRTTTNLNLRAGPGVQQPRLATLQKDVLARILSVATAPAGWVEVEVNGHAHSDDPDTIYSEDDKRSSIEAKRSGARLDTTGWQLVQLTGYLGTGYLVVVDGPA